MRRHPLEALKKVISDKGLEDEAKKALSDAMEKVAEAHGCKLGGMEEISPEEMKAVAGGEGSSNDLGCTGTGLNWFCAKVTWE